MTFTQFLISTGIDNEVTIINNEWEDSGCETIQEVNDVVHYHTKDELQLDNEFTSNYGVVNVDGQEVGMVQFGEENVMVVVHGKPETLDETFVAMILEQFGIA